MKNGSRLKRGISKALIGIMISVCAVFSGWGVTTVQAMNNPSINQAGLEGATASFEVNDMTAWMIAGKINIIITANHGYKLDNAFKATLLAEGEVYDATNWQFCSIDRITATINDDGTCTLSCYSNSLEGPTAFYHNDGVIYVSGKATPISDSTEITTTETEYKHTHEYEWVTVREATDDMNAEEVYQCKYCGDVKYRMEVPNSAYAQFNQNAITAIDRAPSGAAVKLKTNLWVSFRSEVIETLKERPDVSVTIDYLYQGIWYRVTIPAGADLDALEDSEGYYGFRYLDQAFGGSLLY